MQQTLMPYYPCFYMLDYSCIWRVIVYYFDSVVYSLGVLLNSEVHISLLFIMT